MLLRPTLLKFHRIVCYNSVRACTNQINSSQTETQTQSPSSWKPVYKFPQITFFAKLNKLKVYQSAATAVGVPALMGLQMAGKISAEIIEVFAILGYIQWI